MRIEIDTSIGTAYIFLRPESENYRGIASRTRHVLPGHVLLVHVDDAGRLVGIEIIGLDGLDLDNLIIERHPQRVPPRASWPAGTDR